jgi:hypothetical protein
MYMRKRILSCDGSHGAARDQPSEAAQQHCEVDGGLRIAIAWGIVVLTIDSEV